MSIEQYNQNKKFYKIEKRRLWKLLVLLVFALALFWYANHSYDVNFINTL
jgi:hypothetical protein